MKSDLIIYGAYTNFVFRLVNPSADLLYNFVTGAAVTVLSAPTYAATASAVTRDAYIAGYPIRLPDNLPDGSWDLLVYDAGSPANTDNPSVGKRLQCINGNIIGLPISL